jgi:hypothetical protein
LPPEDLFPGDNVECHWIWPPARRPFLLDLWFDWAIPRLLKKVGASSGTGLRKAGLFSFSSGPSTPEKTSRG